MLEFEFANAFYVEPNANSSTSTIAVHLYTEVRDGRVNVVKEKVEKYSRGVQTTEHKNAGTHNPVRTKLWKDRATLCVWNREQARGCIAQAQYLTGLYPEIGWGTKNTSDRV